MASPWGAADLDPHDHPGPVSPRRRALGAPGHVFRP
ncbi:MAG: hypothetical protein JWN57_343, partial [Frankiales bacterium]|nr:hypothetical protein [Frankiales bacterium]